MRIIFFGDIYGIKGRELIKHYLPILKNKYKADVVIANGENATHGRGLSLEHYNELIESGIDIITVGNHFFSRNKTNSYYSSTPNLIRPLNLISGTSGVGSKVFDINNHKVRVSVLLCKVYMKDFDQTNLYDAFDKIKDDDCIHIVDIHGEATAEKQTFGRYVDGRVSAILGTHTHVQTADETILPNGSGYISDVGMNGVKDSIIGANIEDCIIRDKENPNIKLNPAVGKGMVNGVFLDIDDKTYKCIKIERINFDED